MTVVKLDKDPTRIAKLGENPDIRYRLPTVTGQGLASAGDLQARCSSSFAGILPGFKDAEFGHHSIRMRTTHRNN